MCWTYICLAQIGDKDRIIKSMQFIILSLCLNREFPTPLFPQSQDTPAYPQLTLYVGFTAHTSLSNVGSIAAMHSRYEGLAGHGYQ